MPVAMDNKEGLDKPSSPKKKGFSSEAVGDNKEGFKKRPGGKRSFLQRAKRFGKQGRLGRGFQVDSETYGYFVHIFDRLKNEEFESDEDREILVENSLQSAEDSEVNLSSNQLVSRVLENILPLASEERIGKFCDTFLPSLRVIVADPFASHVFEKLLELTSSDKWRSSERLTTWFESASMFVLNNFEDFTFDIYGSFVTKKVLECLSGHVQQPGEETFVFRKLIGLQLDLYGQRKHNAKWQTMLQDFAKRFASWPQFNDLGHRPETARLLQNVIENVSKTEKSEDIVRDLVLKVLATLPETIAPEDLANRTLEVCLTVVDQKMYDLLYNKFYKGRLLEFCTGHCFTVLKLIQSIPHEKYLNSIIEEFGPSMQTLLQDGKIAVINSLIIQSVKFEAKQKELYKSLKDAAVATFGKDANLALVLITLGRPNIKNENDDEDDNEETQPNTGKASYAQFSTYYGSNAVQHLIDFQNPQEILKAICQLEPAQLKQMSLDPKASFIITKFFKNWNVPQKMKLKLLDKLKDFLVEFATTKFGSRIIDVIWLWAGIQQKTVVAEVLSERVPLLAANKFGKFLVESLGLNAFKRNKKEWVEHMVSGDKKKQDALDIAAELGIKSENNTPKTPTTEQEEDSTTPKKKKKNKRKSESAPAEESSTSLTLEETISGGNETPRKKKKKDRKSNVVVEQDSMEVTEEMETPKKKKKKQKRASSSVNEEVDVSLEAEETPQKKKKNKKNRKSQSQAEEPDLDKSALTDNADTPNKKKKKDKKNK